MADHRSIILPATALAPSPSVEMAGQYLSGQELTGQSSTTADLARHLGAMRRSDVIAWVSSIMEAVSQSSGVRTQMELARAVLEPKIVGNIQEMTAGLPKWAIFHRRQLWLLLQMTVIASSEDTPSLPPDETRFRIGTACLMASDFLYQIESQNTSPIEPGHDALKWLINILVSHTEAPTTNEVLARAHLLWFESRSDPTLQKEFARLNAGKDYDEAFARKHGLTLTEFFFIAVSFYFHFLSSAVKRPISPCLLDASVDSGALISDADKRKTLELLAINVNAMPGYLFGRPRQSWTMDFSPLQRNPLLEVFPGKYACPDLSHYRLFIVDGIFWLLNNAIGDNAWRKYFGYVYEWYINQLITSFTSTSEIIARTFFPSPKFEGTEDQVCDGLIFWGKTAALCEYKSFRLTPYQRSGVQSEATLKAIDDNLVTGGVGQLAKSLKRILEGKTLSAAHRTLDLSSCDQILPILIVHEESIGNHAVRMHLQESLTSFLSALAIDISRIGSLLLFTTHDIETFERFTRQRAAESLMRDYADFVRREPRNPNSAFHVYAHTIIPPDKWPNGLVTEKLLQLLRDIEAEHDKRKEPS